jgi:hypothetical protein
MPFASSFMVLSFELMISHSLAGTLSLEPPALFCVEYFQVLQTFCPR